MGREAFSTNVVAQGTELCLDGFPGATTVVLQQVGYVFQNEEGWPLCSKDGLHIKEQPALFTALKTQLVTSLREGLTGKASRQNVVGSDF